jgi:hypothetical protein
MLGDQKHDRFAVFDGMLGLGKLGIGATDYARNESNTN